MFDSDWTINQVEDMDILSYLDLLSYRINSKNESGEKDVYIDEIFGL